MKSGSILARTAIIALLLAGSEGRHLYNRGQAIMQVGTEAHLGAKTTSQMMVSLDLMLESAKEAAFDADSGDLEDKEAAKKKVSELKDTLKKLKDQVIEEAEKSEENKAADSAASSERVNRISRWVKQIAKKIPVITKLEKKLGMLQGLDPVLEGIVKDLERITDFSKMIELQKEHAEKQVE